MAQQQIGTDTELETARAELTGAFNLGDGISLLNAAYELQGEIDSLVAGLPKKKRGYGDCHIREAMQRMADCRDLDDDTLTQACNESILTLLIIRDRLYAQGL